MGYIADPTETQFSGVIRDRDGEWRAWNVQGATSTIIYAITESGASPAAIRMHPAGMVSYGRWAALKLSTFPQEARAESGVRRSVCESALILPARDRSGDGHLAHG
jgi:hypothetical protein